MPRLAPDVEQHDREHHADDQVGKGRDHKRPHRTRAAQHAVAHELDADNKVERRNDEQIL